MANKQVIHIEVTWEGWRKLQLNSLIAFIAGNEALQIKRLVVKEPKK